MSEESKLVRILEKKIGEKRAKSILRAGMGVLWGTIDSISSGLPIITAGLPILEYARFIDIYSRNDPLSNYAKENIAPVSEHIKSLITYILGASVPFVIRYHKEIADLSNRLF